VQTPETESFRSKWQEQLASLSRASDGSSADLENGEGAADEIASGDSHGSMAELSPPLLSLPLKLSGEAQGAQARPASGRPLNVARNANGAVGTGVPGTGQTIAKGLDAASPRNEVRQPAGSSSSARAAKSQGSRAAVAAKNQRPIPGDGASSAAATPIQIPASEIRNTAQARTIPAKVEIGPSSSIAHEAEASNGGPSGKSLLAAPSGAAPDSVGKSVAAQDSKGIESQPNTLDEQPAHSATEVGTLTANAAATPVGRMNAEALTKSPETHPALSATTTGQDPPLQGTGGGAEPVAGRELELQAKPLPAGEPSEAGAGLRGGNSPSSPGAKRSQHAAGATQERGSTAQGQIAAGAGDATATVRDPAAAGRGPVNPVQGSLASAEPALRETFAALDADPSPGALTWTHASARQAEAGFQDPALGWIGVRADRNGGGVHAELVPGSAEAARELGTHLDGLNGYLAAQHTQVESLKMAAPEGNVSSSAAGQGADHGAGHGSGHGMGQGENSGSGQNTRQQAYSEAEPAGANNGPGGAATAAPSDQPVPMNSAAQSQSSGGVYISVMA